MDETRLPLVEHLTELRSRLIRIVAAWLALSAVAIPFGEQIFGLMIQPAREALARELISIKPHEQFFVYLKSSLLAGFMASLPVCFWQLWAFISPGLYAKERKAVLPFVGVSTLLFIGGSLFGYTQVFPLMFGFFASFDNELVQSAWSAQEVFALTTRLFLAFGASFEMPVLVFFLAISGIVDAPTLFRGTPYATLGVFIFAAILTPPDWVSQIFLAIPMIALYLLGVGVAYMFGGKKREEPETTKSVAPR
jgi:sec-independent protein translocase protein TatC